MRQLKNERKGFKRHYNDIGVIAGFYSPTIASSTLGSYLQEMFKEELRIKKEQGEVILYKLNPDELKKYQ